MDPGALISETEDSLESIGITLCPCCSTLILQVPVFCHRLFTHCVCCAGIGVRGLRGATGVCDTYGACGACGDCVTVALARAAARGTAVDCRQPARDPHRRGPAPGCGGNFAHAAARLTCAAGVLESLHMQRRLSLACARPRRLCPERGRLLPLFSFPSHRKIFDRLNFWSGGRMSCRAR
jgi:hypothetical protein